MEFIMKPIGVIHTPLKDKKSAPIQSARSDYEGRVEVFTEFLEGLEGLEDFSHIYLIYGFHCSDNNVRMKVQPFLDDRQHGVFATRYPCRPNPIGFSVVAVISRNENMVFFKGADMLDGTPLLDIKPYIPEFDVFQVEKKGWYQNRKHA
jgi:tRNA-Thr(GGU) m(6)t(6)A37 methyltransferase TsaA